MSRRARGQAALEFPGAQGHSASLPGGAAIPPAEAYVLRVEEGLQCGEERAGLGGVDEVSGVYGDAGAVGDGR